MIVNRRTFVVKQGREHKAIELLKGAVTGHPHPHPGRVYRPQLGPFNVLVLEIEFENLEDYERYFAEFRASPGQAEFMEKWFELTKEGGANEIWTVDSL
jgi:hypothetical protein